MWGESLLKCINCCCDTLTLIGIFIEENIEIYLKESWCWKTMMYLLGLHDIKITRYDCSELIVTIGSCKLVISIISTTSHLKRFVSLVTNHKQRHTTSCYYYHNPCRRSHRLLINEHDYSIWQHLPYCCGRRRWIVSGFTRFELRRVRNQMCVSVKNEHN